nr:transcription factor DIVARICATA-like [Populus alba]
MNSSSSSSPNRERVKWTLKENKLFENAIAEFDPGSPDFFKKISERIPEKTLKQTEDHFLMLIEDVEKIESGDKGEGSNSNDKPNQRKKGVPWTGEEHELFLNGLKKYEKGDWRSISRNYVVTRTPSQVASHAQKYFLRVQNSSNTEQKQGYNSSTSRHRRRNSSSSSTTDKAAASMAAAPSPHLPEPTSISNEFAATPSIAIAPSPHLHVPTSISNEFIATPFSHFSSDLNVPASITDQSFVVFPP